MSEVKFVGVDGESYTIGDDHRYTLLAAAGSGINRWTYDPQGLSTVRCLEFILDLPKGLTLVAFGWNYDVNMIARDIPIKQLVELWKTGATRWNGYSLMWIPGKFFHIRNMKRSKRIYDVFGFFQSSFVSALRKWGYEPNGEMETMKTQRSAFDAEMKEQIIEYCLDECNQLADLMTDLDDALHGVGLETKNWIGAGAIASELMKRHKVKESHQYDAEISEELDEEIKRAYFGGRVELFKMGRFQKLYDYDIISAYPSKAISLPILTNGTWKEVDYEPGRDWTLYRVEWQLPKDSIFTPFPVRKGGDIFYSSNGEGTYHSVEVDAAIRVFGDALRVVRGWQFIPSDNAKPFDWIPAEFAHRKELKAKGHAGEKCLKLGLNSIYGKLAQGVGFGDKPPPFQSYFWAGYITAATRANVIDVAAHDLDALVMIATDGIFFDRNPKIPERNELGGLELTVGEDCFVAQPGIYSYVEDGVTIGKCRGFFTREVDFDELREGFDREGEHYIAQFESVRFMGLGACLLTKDLDSWRTWKKTTRKLSLYPNRKFAGGKSADGLFVRHFPPTMPDSHLSEIYTPRPGFATLTDEELDAEVTALLAYIQGTEQPLKDY